MIFVEEGALYGTSSTALIPLALATNCSLNFSVDAFDVTSKDSGSWSASIPGMKSWDMSTDNLYCPFADKLMALAIARTTLKLYWIPSLNTESSNTVTHEPSLTVDGNTYKYYVGDAWINSISASAANNEASNYSASFTGTGALTPSNSLPSVGIGTNVDVLHLVQDGSAPVVVSNFTGTLSATTSNAKITCTIANGVATIKAASDAPAGAYYVTISDSGTSTSTYVYVTVTAA